MTARLLPPQPPVNGVCVFDLDGTLYKYKCKHGERDGVCQQRVAAVIQQCKQMGMGLAINTARFRLSSRLKRYLVNLGLDVNALPAGAVQLKAFTPQRKARAMQRISTVYNTHPSHVLLYDNLDRNVASVVNRGYRGVNVARVGFVHPGSALQQ
jgi:hypothetical protein